MRAALLSLLLLSALCHADESVELPSPLFQLVGVCPDPDDPSRPAIVWRPAAPGLDSAEAMRVFKHLEGRDVDACLLAVVANDSEASGLLRSFLGKESDAPSYATTINAVFRAWTAAGFDEALAEVARDGRRGPKVAVLLEFCKALQGDTLGQQTPAGGEGEAGRP